MRKIRVGITGGAGYTGGELLRILLHHPGAEILFVHSRSNCSRKLYEVHEDLIGDTELSFTDTINTDVDVIFLCNPHGESARLLRETEIPESVRIIDLSQDHRPSTDSNRGKGFVYGLSELNREHIRNSCLVANPGCFATAVQLAVLPVAANGLLLSDIHVNATTGSTGAGQAPSVTTHHSWRNNNHSTYKPFTHQHLDEIGVTLKKVSPEFPGGIHFIPQRGSFSRGIHVSAYFKSNFTQEQAETLYNDYYRTHPFTYLVNTPVHVKQVVNTNKCYIQIEKHKDHLLVTSVIDNLLKGASGQAVQNFNIMFGLDETTGLKLKASVY